MISKRLIKDRTRASEITVGPPIGTFTAVNRTLVATLPAGMIDESVFDEVDKVYSEDADKK